jgi:hypothetical protein
MPTMLIRQLAWIRVLFLAFPKAGLRLSCFTPTINAAPSGVEQTR